MKKVSKLVMEMLVFATNERHAHGACLGCNDTNLVDYLD